MPLSAYLLAQQVAACLSAVDGFQSAAGADLQRHLGDGAGWAVFGAQRARREVKDERYPMAAYTARPGVCVSTGGKPSPVLLVRFPARR